MKRLLLVCLMILCLVPIGSQADESTQHPDPDSAYILAEASLAEAGLEKIDYLDAYEFLNNTWVYVYLCRNTQADSTNPSGFAALLLVWAPETGAIPLEVVYIPEYHDGAWVMPSADEIQTSVFQDIAALPVGSAGSSLQIAGEAAELWWLGLEYRFDMLDAETLGVVMQEAWASLSAEEQADFMEKAPAVLAEAHRLLDPSEPPGGLYEDEDLVLIMDSLRADPSVCTSVEALLAGVESATGIAEEK